MTNKWFKVGGIIVGSAALYLAGTAKSSVIAIVAGVFALAGVISSVFKIELEE